MLETAVGDRYVLEALSEGGLSLGGEQSGRIVFSEYSTTGDGLLTGLQLVGGDGAHGQDLSRSSPRS